MHPPALPRRREPPGRSNHTRLLRRCALAARQRPPHSRLLNSLPRTRTSIYVKPNSKRPGAASGDRFAKYQPARSVSEYLKLGGTKSDLANDLKKGIATTVND